MPHDVGGLAVATSQLKGQGNAVDVLPEAIFRPDLDRVAIIDQSHIAEEGPVSQIFSEPKTRIGKQLILGDAGKNVEFGERKVRLVFDGNVSQEPVIANLVLACKTPVNIVFANMKEIDGKSFGQMVIELPADETERSRALHFLAANQIKYEEVR